MKVFKPPIFIIIIGFIFLIISYIIITNILEREYGHYGSINTCINNNFKIEKIKDYKGTVFINDSIYIKAAYSNLQPVEHLYESLKEGDSISMYANNDTIFFFRGKMRKWFIYFGEKCGENDGLNDLQIFFKNMLD